MHKALNHKLFRVFASLWVPKSLIHKDHSKRTQRNDVDTKKETKIKRSSEKRETETRIDWFVLGKYVLMEYSVCGWVSVRGD